MSDWKRIIGTVAPWIGTALGTPLGGMAIGAIADVLGLSERTEESIKQAISGATPEQMLAIKQADNDFAIKMKELGFKDKEMLLANTESARDMQKSTKSKVPAFLAAIVTFGFFLILGLMMFGKVDTSNPAFMMLLGALSSGWGAVMNFYFGSAHLDNDDEFKNILRKK